MKAEEIKILEKYMPLGSIVILKNSIKKMMIVARGVVSGSDKEKQVYDYGAIFYPEGIINDRIIFINQQDISKVIFEGYTDGDDKLMNDNIKTWLNEVKNKWEE